MGEGEVPHLPVELPLPLAVDAHLGHLDDVTNLQGDNWNIFRASLDNQLSFTDLQSESSFVVSIGNSTLFDSSVGWQGSLGNTSVRTYCVRIVEETVDAYLYIWMPRLGTILCVVIWRTILMVLCSFVNLEMMEINLKIELFCFHRKSLKTQPKRQVSCFYKRLLQISTKNA